MVGPLRFVTGIVRGQTILRAAQNAAAASLSFNGVVLELGATEWAPLPSRLCPGAWLIRGNIDRAQGIDVCFDVLEGFPFRTDCVDVVVALNVLEHLDVPEACVREAWRVLRSGGRLIVAVPFLYRLHPSPEDHYRFSLSGLRVVLEKAGFEMVHGTITGGGRFTSALGMIDDLRLPGWLRLGMVLLAIAIDWLATAQARYRHGVDYWTSFYPCGYLVEARPVKKGNCLV